MQAGASYKRGMMVFISHVHHRACSREIFMYGQAVAPVGGMGGRRQVGRQYEPSGQLWVSFKERLHPVDLLRNRCKSKKSGSFCVIFGNYAQGLVGHPVKVVQQIALNVLCDAIPVQPLPCFLPVILVFVINQIVKPRPFWSGMKTTPAGESMPD